MTPTAETKALATLKNLPLVDEILEALDINKVGEDCTENQQQQDDVLSPR